ncbi:MAG: hypothetical protein ACR2MP_11190 [Streptosporangiaceae bacterium]
MASAPEAGTLAALVPLMYRADWAAVSLSGTVTSWTDHALRIRVRDQGRRHAPADPDPAQQPQVTEDTYRVLLAPGGKYRISHLRDGQVVHEGCDGVTGWLISPASPGTPGGPGLARVVRHEAAPWPRLDDLQFPPRLLSRFSLELTGPAEAEGRLAYRLAGRARALSGQGRSAQARSSAAQVRLLLDARTGLLLSYEELFMGQPVHRTGRSGIRLGPTEAADPARFRPPRGIDGPGQPSGGPTVAMPGLAGDVVRGAAGLAASAMGFAVRHWPGSPTPAGGAGGRAGGGTGDTGTSSTGTSSTGSDSSGSASSGGWTGPSITGPLDPGQLEPVSDQVINLLHRTGRAAPHFTAEVREWTSARVLAAALSRTRDAMPPALDGILGPDAVLDAFGARVAGATRIVRLRVAGPGRYRIDQVAGDQPAVPDILGCDGDRQWQVTRSRLTAWVGARPARPLPPEFSCLADPAWLLGAYRLQAGGETEVGGRRGLAAVGRWHRDGEPPGPEYFWPGSRAEQVEAVVDAELAILLRLTGFMGDQPVICYEMRGLVPDVANARAFDVPPGAHSRGPLNHLGLTPAGAAKKAAWLGAAGASSLVGWLQKRPRS